MNDQRDYESAPHRPSRQTDTRVEAREKVNAELEMIRRKTIKEAAHKSRKAAIELGNPRYTGKIRTRRVQATVASATSPAAAVSSAPGYVPNVSGANEARQS